MSVSQQCDHLGYGTARAGQLFQSIWLAPNNEKFAYSKYKDHFKTSKKQNEACSSRPTLEESGNKHGLFSD